MKLTPDSPWLQSLWHDGCPSLGERLVAGVGPDENALCELFDMDAARGYYNLPDRSPFVRAVMVSSLDGQTVGEDGSSRSISTPEDYWTFTTLRGLGDVIVVGGKTAVLERLALPRGRDHVRSYRTSRGLQPTPVLAIVTTTGALPDTNLFDRPDACIVLTTNRCLERVAQRIEQEQSIAAGVRPTIVACAELSDGGIDPLDLIAQLGALGLRNIVCEGGPTLLGTLIAAGGVDELALSMAYRVVGGAVMPWAYLPDFVTENSSTLEPGLDSGGVTTSSRWCKRSGLVGTRAEVNLFGPAPA